MTSGDIRLRNCEIGASAGAGDSKIVGGTAIKSADLGESNECPPEYATGVGGGVGCGEGCGVACGVGFGVGFTTTTRGLSVDAGGVAGRTAYDEDPANKAEFSDGIDFCDAIETVDRDWHGLWMKSLGSISTIVWPIDGRRRKELHDSELCETEPAELVLSR